MLNINHQRTFTNKLDYQSFSVVRIHNSQVKKLGGRGAWVKISGDNGKCVYRMIKGFGNQHPFPNDAMELDYDALTQELGVITATQPSIQNTQGNFYPCAFEITPVKGVVGLLKAHWFHPNPGYKVPLQISLISLVLGAFGMALGLISIGLG